MAEFTNVAAQTVAANGNVVYSNAAVKGSNCIQHREGSGIITLRVLMPDVVSIMSEGITAVLTDEMLMTTI